MSARSTRHDVASLHCEFKRSWLYVPAFQLAWDNLLCEWMLLECPDKFRIRKDALCNGFRRGCGCASRVLGSLVRVHKLRTREQGLGSILNVIICVFEGCRGVIALASSHNQRRACDKPASGRSSAIPDHSRKLDGLGFQPCRQNPASVKSLQWNRRQQSPGFPDATACGFRLKKRCRASAHLATLYVV
jgi:hypothetical protein